MDKGLALLSQKFSLIRLRLANRSARAQIMSVGTDLHIEPPFAVRGGDNIIIGRGFRSMSGLFLFANDGALTIGDGCSLNTNVYIGASNGSITIGSHVLMGPNVVLRAADHGILGDAPVTSQPHSRGSITIEDDVWIGANCVVTRNVRVGRGSIIGAGSVVTRDVPPGVVAAGVPARVIAERKDFSPE